MSMPDQWGFMKRLPVGAAVAVMVLVPSAVVFGVAEGCYHLFG